MDDVSLWRICPEDLADDAALAAAVPDVYGSIMGREMAGDPMLNPALGIEQRALRRIEGWRVLLLLTPWMFVRLLFPDESPAIPLPDGWSEEARRDASYLVLGPRIAFTLLGQAQQGHLSFHPRLGHYLLQPICLDMEDYRDVDAVFKAWGEVIRVRDENMEKARRDCPLQREISRRELFRRIGVPKD